jgi:two-component system NtrC family sensor kinase
VVFSRRAVAPVKLLDILRAFASPGNFMQARRDATVRLLTVLMAAVVLVPAALFAYAGLLNYRTTFVLADERIERSLDVVDEHATKVFQSVNLTLTAFEARINGLSDDQIRASQQAIHLQLKDFVAQLTAVNGVWLFDANGRTLVTSFRFPAPQELEVKDRDYFRAHVEGDAGTYVGEVILPRVSDQPFFAVSRRRPSADGTFTGVIVAALLPGDFHRFYQRLAQQRGSNYTMVRDDGNVLTRYPGPLFPLVRLDQASGFMQMISRNPQGGFYTTVSQVDDTVRRIAVRKLFGLPVYISTGLGVTELKEEWRATMASHLVFGLPATLLMALLVWLTLRRTNELYAEATRRMAAEDTLRQSQKMEAVGQLTGGVAHDFNNLLTIIIGNLEIALRKGVGERVERVLNNALTGAQKAAQLTQRLLAFSRRQPLDPKSVDANKLIGGMSDLLRRALGEQIDMEVVGGGGLWRTEVDPAELEAAILNLALNARDAMPEGGNLTIETSNAFLDEHYVREYGVKAGQYVLISVTDTGKGMPREILDRAFEPFFTTKVSGQGTGLGLSQVYGFIKQSGGHVKIYSEVGQGTTVKLYLPRQQVVNEPQQPPKSEPPRPGSGEVILVVEDDEGVREYVTEVLKELNYRVMSAPDGAEALRLLKDPEKHVDLLLTDVVLPGMNGRQLAEAVMPLRPGLRVLFMTGYSRNAIVHQGRLDPGVFLIQKPLSAATLAAKIREVMSA